MAGTYEVDPISRIEGHLGVKVGVSGAGAGCTVTGAAVHGNLWRGFENFLIGRDANDAITFTQRICGVCPVPHGMTSTYAIDTVFGYSQGHITFKKSGDYGVPLTALHVRNLVLSAEFLMSSITHFYHLAAPSYVQGPAIPPWTPYFATDYYFSVLRSGGAAKPRVDDANKLPSDLWSAVIKSYVKALRARRLALEAGALFAGRMPMTSCYVAGGVTNHFGSQTALQAVCDKYKEIITEVGKFIIKEYVPIALVLGYMYPEWDNGNNTGDGSVVGKNYGAGCGNFLSWGAFPDQNDALGLPGGYWTGGTGAVGATFTVSGKSQMSTFLSGPNSVPSGLTESIEFSRYGVSALDTAASSHVNGVAYPGAVFRTMPNRTKSGAYSYLKAPRWAGQPCEVGPLARLIVAGIYPVKNAAFAAHPGVSAEYVPYTTLVGAGPSGVGLDTRMVHHDVGYALVRAGLATLNVPNDTGMTSTPYNSADVSGADFSAVADLYYKQTTGAYAQSYVTGPLTNWILTLKGGLSTMDRLRARALESLVLVQKMIGSYDKATDTFSGDGGWIAHLRASGSFSGNWQTGSVPTGPVSGWGGTEAPRGALMHQVSIDKGKITKYQCIVPTTWNASPKTSLNAGPMEQALIGVPFNETTGTTDRQHSGTATRTITHRVGGVEVLRVAQSFDPCIACAVH